MVQTTTTLDVADNSGAKKIMCIRVLGGTRRKYASLGDIIFAEPKALIGFAGPRVIEQTIRQKLPEGFQRSEFLLEHGMLDLIIDRREMKATIARALGFMGAAAVAAAAVPMPVASAASPDPLR